MVSGRAWLISLTVLLLSAVMVFLNEVSAWADSSDYGIEQIYINMPEVTVFYRGGDGQAEATLDGEVLTIDEAGTKVFSDTGLPVEYYILTDISGSIPDSRFEDIKNSLTSFVENKREADKVILYSFGDEVTLLLDGSESMDDASSIIAGMVNDNQSTVLYDAIDIAADAIVTAGDTSQSRRLIVVISDGKDCADNTRSNSSAEYRLNSDGIGLYTIAVENDEGDSEEVISQYQGQYASISRNTGGLPWTAPSPDTSISEGLEIIRSGVMSSYYALYRAGSNRISKKNEDFILDCGGNHVLKRSVYVARNQPDTTFPVVSIGEEGPDNEIRIIYSEPVQNAEKSSSYSVTLNGESIPVSQVIEENEGISYRLIFHDNLKGGNYQIAIGSAVADVSNEKNPLEQRELIYMKEAEETEAETEPAREENKLIKLLKEWWILLVIAAAALLLIIVLIVRHHKKRKENNEEQLFDSVGTNDYNIAPGDHNLKNHVKLNNVPSRDIVIWISNGKDEPKQLNQHISGSLIVGRSTSCDLYCDDPMMSKQHFVIEIQDDELLISDLGSRNGTAVNGVSLRTRQKLASRDEITAGNLKFTVEW